MRRAGRVGRAGSGKTVQAQLYGQHHGLPVSWITLDSSYSSPRRLLTGLGEALRAHRRADADVVTRSTFHFEATLEETAALTAGSVLPEPALLVVDECEHLDASADAQVALETFLEYRPGPLQVLLLSRTDLPGPLQQRMLDGRIGLVTDDQMRLTAEENEQLGELLGGMPEQRSRIREATGGWTAGAAFSFRYGLHEQHISNDLPSVIMNDVLSGLPAPNSSSCWTAPYPTWSPGRLRPHCAATVRTPCGTRSGPVTSRPPR